MLIPSPRHHSEDLTLWRELEQADLIAKVPLDQITKSLTELNSFAEGGRCYVGCSWGKDSVVLLHLLTMCNRELPVVWVRMHGRDNPDCIAVRDTFTNRFNIKYHERIFDYERCSHDEHWAAVDEEFGSRRITGLRADESGVRAMSMRCRGLSTSRSCRPLGWWKQRDIFAWMAQNDLPVHPAYACLGGGRWPRKNLRTHGIGGVSGTNFGRREWEREYYGDVLNRLLHGTVLLKGLKNGANYEP